MVCHVDFLVFFTADSFPRVRHCDIALTHRSVFLFFPCPFSREENAPLVIQEAQQCRVPVITAAFGGMGELVKDGVNGLTFEHRSADSLAQAMLKALRDPLKMQTLGGAGYLHSKDGRIPSIENHVAEVGALYERLFTGGSVQPTYSGDVVERSDYRNLLLEMKRSKERSDCRDGEK